MNGDGVKLNNQVQAGDGLGAETVHVSDSTGPN